MDPNFGSRRNRLGEGAATVEQIQGSLDNHPSVSFRMPADLSFDFDQQVKAA